MLIIKFLVLAVVIIFTNIMTISLIMTIFRLIVSEIKPNQILETMMRFFIILIEPGVIIIILLLIYLL